MDKEPFVSGAYRREPEKPLRSIEDIFDEAKEKRGVRRRLHQRYDSRGTRATRRATLRILGERDD